MNPHKKSSHPASAGDTLATDHEAAAQPLLRAERKAELPSDGSAYTLEQLSRRNELLPQSEKAVRALVTLDNEALTAIGSLVSTERIDTDAARLYGQALDFFLSANESQSDALFGLSLSLLSGAIWAARHGQELARARDSSQALEASRQSARERQAAAVRKQAMGSREQLRAALLGLAGGDRDRESEIDEAYGTASTPMLLSQSITRLVQLGQRYLADKDPGVLLRRQGIRLDKARLDKIAGLAAEVLRSGEAGEAPREAAAVSQSEVDLWDGINLTLLARVMELFDAGHLVDATVPRLQPLSLRSYFRRGRTNRKGRTPAPPAPPPANS